MGCANVNDYQSSSKTRVDANSACNAPKGSSWRDFTTIGTGLDYTDMEPTWISSVIQSHNQPTASTYKTYSQNNPGDKVVGAYFSEWSVYKAWANGPYDISHVPWTNLTHFVYAFFPVCAPYDYFPQYGVCTENDCTNQHITDANGIWSPFHNLYAACGYKCSDWDISIHDPWASLTGKCGSGSWGGYAFLGKIAYYKDTNKIQHTKIIPSIGGWTLSKLFFHLNNVDHRNKFVSSVKSFLISFENVFDGVDIDWEFPGGGGNDSGATVELAPMTFDSNNKPTISTWTDEVKTVEVEGNTYDSDTYVSLMKDLRKMLNELGGCPGELACFDTATGNRAHCSCSKKYYELSSGISAGHKHIGNVEYDKAIQYMDHLYLMSYDFWGAFDLENLDHQTNPHNNYKRGDHPTTESMEQAVDLLIAQGVPSEKIIGGAAFYGRGWNGVTKKDGTPEVLVEFTDEYGRTALGYNYFDGSYHGSGAWSHESQETSWDRLDGQMPGILDYSDLKRYIDSGDCVEFFDECAQAPLAACFPSGNSVDVVTYDNPRSIMAKGRIMREKNMGGLFTWVLDADDGTLLNALNEAAGNTPANGSAGDYAHFNNPEYARKCGGASSPPVTPPLPPVAPTSPPVATNAPGNSTGTCVALPGFGAWEPYCNALTADTCESPANSAYCHLSGCVCTC